jgi:hypothetical protein
VQAVCEGGFTPGFSGAVTYIVAAAEVVEPQLLVNTQRYICPSREGTAPVIE